MAGGAAQHLAVAGDDVATGALGHDGETVLAAQDSTQPGPHQVLVVDHQDGGAKYHPWPSDRPGERAFRLGVNLVMYALCLDYKEDQVHIPFILKKRRR